MGMNYLRFCINKERHFSQTISDLDKYYEKVKKQV